MLNSADTVVFPSPSEPPMIDRCAIRGARSGIQPEQERDVGQRADRRDGHRLRSLAQDPGDQLDGVLGVRRCRGGRQLRRPDATLPVDLGRADDLPDQWAGGAFGDRDVVATVGVQESQRVLGAVADVGVAAHGRDRQDLELRSRDGQPDRQRVIEAGIAVDDQRQRPLARAHGGTAWARLRAEEGRDGVDRSRPVRIAGAHPVSPGRMAGRPRPVHGPVPRHRRPR